MQFMEQYINFSGLSVLDVGCGGGILSEAMALAGARVTGLDIEPESIATAGAHATAGDLNIQYVCELIEEYDAPLFDAVICMEMLEHVAEPQWVIQHCARLLKPGGYLFLSTINRTLEAYASVVIAAEYVLGLLPKQTHDYDKFIKPSELASMARGEGLEVIGLSGMGYNPYTRVSFLKESIASNYLLACRK
jgi:2-polyprenyl-6-hydroxyphenyl methylase/3-demethylubiquinone-9 3-methyltransferase